jgi:hypothetical protein
MYDSIDAQMISEKQNLELRLHKLKQTLWLTDKNLLHNKTKMAREWHRIYFFFRKQLWNCGGGHKL